METNELKPCPFCGCEPEIQTVMDASDKAKFTLIRCSNENCDEVSTGWCRTNSEAIAAWNSRAEETTIPTNDKLKPCPFCGGQGDFYFILTMRRHWIGCRDCNCATDGYETEEQAVEAWNRRANDAY